MRRLLFLMVLSVCLVVGFASQLSAQETVAPTWRAEYRFVAPPIQLGNDAQAGTIALTLTNLIAGDAKNVLVQVAPDTQVGFGPANSEQVGIVKQGATALVQTELLILNTAKSFVISLSWKDSSGLVKTAKISAVQAVEAAQ